MLLSCNCCSALSLANFLADVDFFFFFLISVQSHVSSSINALWQHVKFHARRPCDGLLQPVALHKQGGALKSELFLRGDEK